MPSGKKYEPRFRGKKDIRTTNFNTFLKNQQYNPVKLRSYFLLLAWILLTALIKSFEFDLIRSVATGGQQIFRTSSFKILNWKDWVQIKYFLDQGIAWLWVFTTLSKAEPYTLGGVTVVRASACTPKGPFDSQSRREHAGGNQSMWGTLMFPFALPSIFYRNQWGKYP